MTGAFSRESAVYVVRDICAPPPSKFSSFFVEV
jgi:hypothetical protein